MEQRKIAAKKQVNRHEKEKENNKESESKDASGTKQ